MSRGNNEFRENFTTPSTMEKTTTSSELFTYTFFLEINSNNINLFCEKKENTISFQGYQWDEIWNNNKNCYTCNQSSLNYPITDTSKNIQIPFGEGGFKADEKSFVFIDEIQGSDNTKVSCSSYNSSSSDCSLFTSSSVCFKNTTENQYIENSTAIENLENSIRSNTSISTEDLTNVLNKIPNSLCSSSIITGISSSTKTILENILQTLVKEDKISSTQNFIFLQNLGLSSATTTPVSPTAEYFDTSNYCSGDPNQNIYINASSNLISTTNNSSKEQCENKCSNDDNCEMYLMSNPTTCKTYRNVSDVKMYCDSGNEYQFYGNVKTKNFIKRTNVVDPDDITPPTKIVNPDDVTTPTSFTYNTKPILHYISYPGQCNIDLTNVINVENTEDYYFGSPLSEWGCQNVTDKNIIVAFPNNSVVLENGLLISCGGVFIQEDNELISNTKSFSQTSTCKGKECLTFFPPSELSENNKLLYNPNKNINNLESCNTKDNTIIAGNFPVCYDNNRNPVSLCYEGNPKFTYPTYSPKLYMESEPMTTIYPPKTENYYGSVYNIPPFYPKISIIQTYYDNGNNLPENTYCIYKIEYTISITDFQTMNNQIYDFLNFQKYLTSTFSKNWFLNTEIYSMSLQNMQELVKNCCTYTKNFPNLVNSICTDNNLPLLSSKESNTIESFTIQNIPPPKKNKKILIIILVILLPIIVSLFFCN